MFKAVISLLCLGCMCYGQSWSGILAPERAIDWSTAGVEGGIPSASWTQCGATISAGASAATIQSAIDGCSANQYVKLGAGTFNLADGLNMKSSVVLRGSGSNQTFLVFSDVVSCAGAFAAICFGPGDSNNYFGATKVQPGGTNAASWTAGYTKGATQITLNSIGSSGIQAGQYIMLDQANDTTTSSGFFVCSTVNVCSSDGGNADPGRVVSSVARQPIQIVKVVSCSPSCSSPVTSGPLTVNITPGLYAPNYESGKTPGAWWPDRDVVISYAGLEDLSLDATNSGGINNITFYNAVNSWVKGTRQIRNIDGLGNQFIISVSPGWHITVQDNYFYGGSSHATNYGIRFYVSSDSLLMNNIFQHNVAPILLHGSVGNVIAYNYAINNTYDDGGSPQYHYMIGMIGGHSAGTQYNLLEGNVGQAIAGDAVHGTPVMNTVFRNYLLGSDPGRTDNTIAVQFEAYARYWNVVGNVLGTPSYTSSYAGSNPAVYQLGSGRGSISSDATLATSLMRWGNYDVVNDAVRWEASEDGHTAADYPALTDASQTLPSSFFLSSRPTWWPSIKVWPAIGPDVTGGNIASLDGHAYTNPAQDCFLGIMAGPLDGSGGVLSFDATSCYYAASGARTGGKGKLGGNGKKK